MRYSKSKSPEVSLVVCHHTGTLLFDFLESLKKCRLELDVIIMTSDEKLSTEGIEHCTVIYSTEGPAAKRNAGVRIAKCEYVAFFDDDVEIYENCIENMLEALKFKDDIAYPRRVRPGMVYGKLHNFEHKARFDEAGSFITWTGFLWSRAEQNLVDEGQYDAEEWILAGKSASCMVRKSIFNGVGGFDEDFGILGEETDLSWRMWLQGFGVLWVPSSYAEHKFNTRYKPVNKHYTSARVQYNGCRNYLTMLIKNLGRTHLWIVPIHATIWFIAGLVMIGTLKIRQGGNILRGLWYCLSNMRTILEKRWKIQSRRNCGDRAIWPIIARAPRGPYYTGRFLRYIKSALHG